MCFEAKDVTVAELRSLVADNYDEATFQLVCAAGQAPSGMMPLSVVQSFKHGEWGKVSL